MATESVKPSPGAGLSEPPAELRLEGALLADRYEIGQPLGEGGLGVVFEALDRKTGQRVALKVLRELYGAQRTFRRRFAREARALEALSHPNVVSIVDNGVTGEMPFLVMELLQGTTLADILDQQHTLSWETARDLFGQLLDGLAYVHLMGLLHRDLKPGNVFLEDTAQGERVKLLDFGLAKFVDGPGKGLDATLTKTGQLFGTPGYMPPEQYLGQKTDVSADVYSATLILYEMLAGQRPFFGGLSEMAKQQLGGKVPPLHEVRPSMRAEPELQAFFEKGLKPEPHRRFASVAELRAAFEALPNPPIVPLGRPLEREGDISTDDTVLHRRAAAAPRSSQAETAEMQTRAAVGETAARSDVRAAAPRRSGSLLGGLLRWLLILCATGLVVALLAKDRLAPMLETSDLPQLIEGTAESVVTTARDLAEQAMPAPTPREEEQNAEGQGPDGAEPAAPSQAEEEETQAREDATPSTEQEPVRWRAPRRDPWRGATPALLRDVRRHVTRGGKGNETMVANLRRNNRDYPNDPRGHLLLARMYFNRGWFGDAVGQYEFAVLRQPSARGEARMLSNLLSLHDSSAWPEAAKLLAETYGPEARRPVAKLLRTKLSTASRKRLERLLERLPPPE